MPDNNTPQTTSPPSDARVPAAPPPPPTSTPARVDAAAEVDRILASPNNAYAVLGLPRDADADAVKAAQRRLSRIVHPDKTNHPRATDAAAAVNRAAEALSTTGWKRTAYDAYVDDLEKGGPGTAQPSFEEWQAAAIKLPPWAARLLTRRGGACLLCLLAIIALPLLLVAVIVSFIICFPLQALLSTCGVVPPPWQRMPAAAREAAAEAREATAQTAAAQVETGRVANAV